MTTRSRIVNTPAIDLLRSMRPGGAGAIITDPPFFISQGRAGYGMGDDPWVEGVSSTDAMVDWYVPLAEQCRRALRPGGACVVMGGAHSISAWQVAADRAGLVWMAELTVLWNTGKPRLRNFGSLTTTIRWHVKPGARHSFNHTQRSIYSNVVVCTKVAPHDRLHPAQKPVELTNFLVSLLTNEDDVVVDPFCGSGSTLVSAAMCERRFLGGDVDIESCRVAETRVKRLELEAAQLNPLLLWINGKTYPVEGD